MHILSRRLVVGDTLALRGVLVTLIALLVALRPASLSGVSYSARFSTAAQVAKYTGLYVVLPENDNGSGLLPKQIKIIRVGVPGTVIAMVD